jgi:hypothetical protein
MGAGIKKAQPNPVEDILKLVQGGRSLFLGNKGSTTTQTNTISNEGAQKLLNNILSNTQGLGALTQGQRSAGLYNSTTSQLLSSDLLARAAAEVEARNSTTRQTTGITAPEINPLAGIATILGAQVLGPTIKEGIAKTGVSNIGETIKNAVFSPSTKDLISMGAGEGIDNSGVTDAIFGGGVNPITQAIQGISGAITTSPLGELGKSLGSLIPDFGGSLIDSGLIDAANASADPIASLFDAGGLEGGVTGSVPVIGPTIKLLSGDPKGAAGTAAGGAIGGAIGNAIFPGVGGAIGTVIGSFVGGSCFITTAVCRKLNLPDDCEQLTTLRNFRDTYMKYSPEREELVAQYYREAPAIVEKLDKLPPEIMKIAYDKLEKEINLAVALIKQGRLETAMHVYQELFNYAKVIVRGAIDGP